MQLNWFPQLEIINPVESLWKRETKGNIQISLPLFAFVCLGEDNLSLLRNQDKLEWLSQKHDWDATQTDKDGIRWSALEAASNDLKLSIERFSSSRIDTNTRNVIHLASPQVSSSAHVSPNENRRVENTKTI